MKTFMRVTALITVVGIIALTITKRYLVPHDLPLFMIIVVVTVLYIALFYVFWFLLFRHWSKARFSSRAVKWIWFWTILAGGFMMFVGPILYYVSVVEMGRTLAGNGVAGRSEAGRAVS